MKSRKQGILSELEFVVEAKKRGLKVSQPIGDEIYDFIIDNGQARHLVQVKSCSVSQKIEREFHLSYYVRMSYGNDKKKIYTKEDIDFFAVHLSDENYWFIIPVENVLCTKITISPDNRKNKFFIYKESWDLLI